MKEFNLKAALNGEPVMLRNGNKAFIFKNIQNTPIIDFKTDYPLIGMAHNHTVVLTWSLNGQISLGNDCTPYDIIGMFEEPKLTSEQLLDKAYNENLLVLCDGNPDLPLKVIAKTKDGEFVMQPEDDTIQPWIANLTMEWFFVKDPDPKLDTITNTIALPKPFKPKSGDGYYYINEYGVQFTRHYDEDDDSDVGMAENAQCYRTREDAQKWLDFMKSMME